MAKVTCSVIETVLEGDHGQVDGVEASCNRCHHTTESYGTSDSSRRRCLALMREECPRSERNFYVED